jgi:type IV secretory pathway protease TraF
MMPCRALVAGVLLVAVGGWLAAPVRWRVEGLSMAPGLMPGEIAASDWFPWVGRLTAPRRLERWTLIEPGGALAVKRVWALPGEAISIVDGDFAVDGAVVVKPPAVLAELALPVPHAISRRTAGSVRVTIDDPVFDDVPFAPDERRLLVPVRDVGITAIVTACLGRKAPSVEVRVGDRLALVRLPTAGRFAVVAGRLDGCFVAGAWPLDECSDGAVIPRRAPTAWGLKSDWTASDPAAACELAVVVGGEGMGVRIESVAAWRDMHALPRAGGKTQCRLGPAECYVLGDFPAASRDSRHWGPLDISRLRRRVAMPPSRRPTIVVGRSPDW